MTLSQIRKLDSNIIEVVKGIIREHPTDPELHKCQAVLNFVAKDYQLSLHHFDEALKYDSTNYSLWNRLASTLAHLNKPVDAIECYYKALECKPNYVRAWVNLAATQAFNGEYYEAARLYLTALSINSRATHIWEHLNVTLIAMGKHDLAEVAKKHNLEIFKTVFEVNSVEDLPLPEIGYKDLHKQVLFKECPEAWAKELC